MGHLMMETVMHMIETKIESGTSMLSSLNLQLLQVPNSSIISSWKNACLFPSCFPPSLSHSLNDMLITT